MVVDEMFRSTRTDGNRRTLIYVNLFILEVYRVFVGCHVRSKVRGPLSTAFSHLA